MQGLAENIRRWVVVGIKRSQEGILKSGEAQMMGIFQGLMGNVPFHTECLLLVLYQGTEDFHIIHFIHNQ